MRIVAYQGIPTAKTAFRIATEPLYRHGANPGDYTFQEVTVGLLLPDGSAAVYDPVERPNWWFSAADEATYEGARHGGRGWKREVRSPMGPGLFHVTVSPGG